MSTDFNDFNLFSRERNKSGANFIKKRAHGKGKQIYYLAKKIQLQW